MKIKMRINMKIKLKIKYQGSKSSPYLRPTSGCFRAPAGGVTNPEGAEGGMDPGVEGLPPTAGWALGLFWPPGDAALSRAGDCCGKQEKRSCLAMGTRVENPARCWTWVFKNCPLFDGCKRCFGETIYWPKILPRREQGHKCPSLENYI